MRAIQAKRSGLKAKSKGGFMLRTFVVGPFGTNCYLLADERTREACVIDPGASPKPVKDELRKNGLELKFIINTHGHGDHIGANASFDCPVYIHKLDEEFLTDCEKNLSAQFLFPVRSQKAAGLLKDGEKVRLGGLELEVLHAPGHTPGSISIKLDGIVFTGDALFSGSVGRTDFPYSDERLLIRSIKDKLLVLGDETVIYPGHGPSSTIGEEKRTNPFLV